MAASEGFDVNDAALLPEPAQAPTQRMIDYASKVNPQRIVFLALAVRASGQLAESHLLVRRRGL